jgi:hypothetical protein
MEPVGAVHYYWQGDTVMVVERYLPAVGVAEVLEYYFLGVELATFRASVGIGRCESGAGKKHGGQQGYEYGVKAVHRV